jgi:ATP-dependent helicase/nuclease subunit B
MPVILKKNHPGAVSDIQAEIRKRLARGAGASFLHVVPTKRKLRDAQRELLREVPGGAALSFHLFTLETLAAQLFSLICSPRRIISGPAQSVLVNEAVHSLRNSLRYFRIPASNRLPKGTLQKLVEVINTFKEKGIYLPVLHAEVAASEPGEALKLRDILSIYEAYETSLGGKFVDPAGMLKSVNAEWDPAVSPAKVRTHFTGVDTIIVSGFDEFSDPELTMLYNLSEPAGTGMLVSFDYHLSNEEIFGHLRENYQKFLQMGFEKVALPRARRSTFEDHIRHHLFRRAPERSRESPPAPKGSAAGAPPRFDCRGKVSLMYARDREQEVETIAKLIKCLAREKPGRDLSRICVATYQPQLYAKLFREAFERFGIPANVTDRYALDQSPFVVALLSLLDVHERNFRLRDIMRALSSPYLVVSSGDAPIDAGNLYEVGTRLKIPAGRTSWDRRIQQRLVEIREELSASGDDGEEAKLRHEESLLRRALKDIESLSALLKRFGSRMNAGQFRDRVLSLLKELRVVECILKLSPETAGTDQIEKDARAYEKFVSFLDEFLEILSLERGVSAVEPLSYFVDRLRSAVSDVRYNVRQRYGKGVVVTSFDETRGLKFEVMIMAGLADGEFPPAYQPEIFFSTARRLRDERYHLTEHRYLFYQALTNYEERLYLTVPRYDGETQIVPSSFVDALLNVAELDDLRKELPPEFSERIYSEFDLLSHLGGVYGRDAATGIGPAELLPERWAGLRPGLVECLGHMRHAMSVERSRTLLAALPEYNGRILEHVGPEHRAALEQLRAGLYSVTQLESFGKCPFQYFADRVLRLNVIPDIEEGVSPLERGGILHEILFEFYLDRRNRSLPPLFSCTEPEFQQSTADLLAIAGRRLTELDAVADPFWELDKEAILGSGNRKGMLKELLEMERDSAVEVKPAYFEAVFGSRTAAGDAVDPSFQLEEPVTAGLVRLRGRIDRIDIGEKSFRIIDYKTGARLPDRRDIDLGISLQLPVYLRVVEQLLAAKETGERTGAAGLYYWLRDPVKQKLAIGSAEHLEEVFIATKQKQLVGTDEDLRNIIDQAIRFVNDYVDRISKGEFPVEPKTPERVCPSCSFGSVCRIRAIRLRETAPSG